MKTEKLDKRIELPKKEEITQGNRKEVSMAIPTKQKCSGLYEAKSVIHQFKTTFGLYNDVVVKWFVQEHHPYGSCFPSMERINTEELANYSEIKPVLLSS